MPAQQIEKRIAVIEHAIMVVYSFTIKPGKALRFCFYIFRDNGVKTCYIRLVIVLSR